MRKRLGWDDYFMIEALWAKVRSPDMSTQCGCVIVDANKKIIGQGYNGHPSKVAYEDMPQERPAKYAPIIHSENNAILNCTGPLSGSTVYVTGPPCVHCWAQLIQVGIKRVVFGPITTSKDGLYKDVSVDEIHPVVKDMLKNHDIEITRWVPQNPSLILNELDKIRELTTLACANDLMDQNKGLMAKLADS